MNICFLRLIIINRYFLYTIYKNYPGQNTNLTTFTLSSISPSLFYGCVLQHGSPLPKLVWKKDGGILPNQTYQIVDSTYSRATLHFKVCNHDRKEFVPPVCYILCLYLYVLYGVLRNTTVVFLSNFELNYWKRPSPRRKSTVYIMYNTRLGHNSISK
jgi:hypothetical protein